MKNLINILLTMGGVITGFLFGEWDGIIIALISFIVIDYITGVINGIVNHKLSSKRGFEGLLKKVVILIVVAIGHLIDVYMLGGGAVVRNAAIFFYISNEGISILENCVSIGVPVPEKIKVILEQIGEDSDGNKETD